MVVGGGFGGIQVVRGLERAPVEVTLVDWRNFHLFQPLTYQVATGSLSPSDVAYPLRAMFGHEPNVRVVLGAVTGFDLKRRLVLLAGEPGRDASEPLAYDTLVVAAGSSYAYFGHEEWRRHAGEVKTLESAISVRSRILTALERAEVSAGEVEQSNLTFVVVGGGPTGVEIAGQIGELARETLPRDYARLKGERARILLVEMGERLLADFPASLSQRAARDLEKLGVTPTMQRTVVAIDAEGVTLQAPDGSHERVQARTVLWAAGVRASELGARLAEQSGTQLDGQGRVAVGGDLTLQGHPEVMVLGDMAAVGDGHGGVQRLPGVAPVAIQQGHYAAREIRRRVAGEGPGKPFRYIDKGNLATIGRGRAVAQLGPLKLSGLPAWIVWLVVHIWYLIGFQNRIVVLLRWSISFLSHGRAQSARIIAGVPASEAPHDTGPAPPAVAPDEAGRFEASGAAGDAGAA